MAYDLVIRGGTLVDGSGAPRFTADVGIKDGMIAEIGRITSAASHTIEADGLIVSPGFITSSRSRETFSRYAGSFLSNFSSRTRRA